MLDKLGGNADQQPGGPSPQLAVPNSPRRGGIFGGRGVIAALVLATGVACGGIFVGCGATSSSQGSSPGESPSDVSRPTASPTGEPTPNIEATSSPTAVVSATPKESVIPADAFRLDKLAARPARAVSNKALEAALLKVESMNWQGANGRASMKRCENGEPDQTTVPGRIQSRTLNCEMNVSSLIVFGEYRFGDPNAQAAVETAYDYTASLITSASAKRQTTFARVDLDLYLWDDLKNAKVPVFLR
jgi:hypothetical protein